MLAEDGVVVHAYYVIFIVFVLMLEIAQQAKFNTCLMLEALLIANNLNGDHRLLHMVEALKSLAEAPGAQLIQHFKSIGQMILYHNLVVTTLIVEAKVVTQ